MNIGSIGGGGGYQANFNPHDMKAKMQAGIEKLKGSNPELAAKMEKIGGRMEELKSSGSNPFEAMSAIQKEFGAPNSAESKEITSALGFDPSQIEELMNIRGGGSGLDIQEMIKGLTGGSGQEDSSKKLIDALFGSSDEESSSKSRRVNQQSGDQGNGQNEIMNQIKSLLSQRYGQGSSGQFAGAFGAAGIQA